MRTLLFMLIALSVVNSGLCCGRHRKKGKGVARAPERDTVVHRLVGKDVETSPYSPGSDNAGDCDQLKCNLDGSQSCCWTNNQPPADQLNWVKGTGQGESAKLQNSFGTTTSPSGNFFITASDVAGTSEQSGQLYSCPITCSESDITVKVKHWQTKGTKVQVCSMQDPAGQPQNCQDLPGQSGQADSVTIPKGQNTRIVIQAKGFTSPEGDVAMVDDIDVQCEKCRPTTTAAPATPAPTAAPTAAPTPAPTKAPPPCKEVMCNFEQGNPCSYHPASSGGNAAEGWGVHSAIYQNRLTGVRKDSPQGKKFGACYTKKKGEKAVLESNANFQRDFVIRYYYYKATQGLILKGCCNDESNCPKQASGDVKTADYGNWYKEAIKCPAGTKKVLFICENKQGASEGACGIDDIVLLESSGGDPNSASKNACT